MTDHATDIDRLRAIAVELDEIAQRIKHRLPETFDRDGDMQEAFDRTGGSVRGISLAADALARTIQETGGE